MDFSKRSKVILFFAVLCLVAMPDSSFAGKKETKKERRKEESSSSSSISSEDVSSISSISFSSSDYDDSDEDATEEVITTCGDVNLSSAQVEQLAGDQLENYLKLKKMDLKGRVAKLSNDLKEKMRNLDTVLGEKARDYERIQDKVDELKVLLDTIKNLLDNQNPLQTPHENRWKSGYKKSILSAIKLVDLHLEPWSDRYKSVRKKKLKLMIVDLKKGAFKENSKDQEGSLFKLRTLLKNFDPEQNLVVKKNLKK